MLIEISLPSAELDHGLYNAGEVLISVESM
jgi:hypothetical protein